MRNRKIGCFYGLAIGDALGAAVEFRRPGEFAEVKSYRGFGPHGLLPGQWTDDTSMALALADSVAKGWDLKSQLENYALWFETGKYSVNDRCFDIGSTTRSALYEFIDNGRLISDDNPELSGNGSIMRLAPVPIKYAGDPEIIKYLAESSQTTHASDQCVSACIALGLILEGLIEGKSKELVLDREFVSEKLNSLVDKVVQGSYKLGIDIRGSGWVVKSLEASLWAFYTSSSFEETVLKAVNLGDDADTTGAIAGQLAGAYYGFDKIPQYLIDGLDRKEMIETYLNPIL